MEQHSLFPSRTAKHSLSAIFFVLAMIAAAVGIFNNNPPVATVARILAFLFGVIFLIFLMVGLVGRVRN